RGNDGRTNHHGTTNDPRRARNGPNNPSSGAARTRHAIPNNPTGHNAGTVPLHQARTVPLRNVARNAPNGPTFHRIASSDVGNHRRSNNDNTAIRISSHAASPPNGRGTRIFSQAASTAYTPCVRRVTTGSVVLAPQRTAIAGSAGGGRFSGRCFAGSFRPAIPAVVRTRSFRSRW